MCGRFALKSKPSEIAEEFGIEKIPLLQPRFNIAPSQLVAAVRANPDRELAMFKWGLIPSWVSDPTIGNRMINARAETIAKKPSFRDAFKQRRCLVVADGFYEWKKQGSGKQPHYIRLKDDHPFGFAGLWERWSRDGEEIESCTIITCEPNEMMMPIHNRMPVILDRDDYDQWLMGDSKEVGELLRPFQADRMMAYPVSTLVNNTANDVERCMERVG